MNVAFGDVSATLGSNRAVGVQFSVKMKILTSDSMELPPSPFVTFSHWEVGATKRSESVTLSVA